MRVYLIRHGESLGNVECVGQGVNDPLTEKGKDEIRKSSIFLKKECQDQGIFPDMIISSTHLRTRESAAIVKEVFTEGGNNLEYKESGLFVERKRPAEQTGIKNTDPEFVRIDDIVRVETSKDWSFAYGDGESPKAAVERAFSALKFLIDEGAQIETNFRNAGTPREAIIVVTSHSYFLRALLGAAVFGEAMNFGKLEYVIRGFSCYNASISLIQKNIVVKSNFKEGEGVEKTPPESVVHQDQRWRVISWNQTEHLNDR